MYAYIVFDNMTKITSKLINIVLIAMARTWALITGVQGILKFVVFSYVSVYSLTAI